VFAVIVAIISIPAVQVVYWQTIETHLSPDEVPMGMGLPPPIAYLGFLVLGSLHMVPAYGPLFVEGFIRCPVIAGPLGAFDGPGLQYGLGQSGGFSLARTSHKACKEFYYDKTAGRVENTLIAINTDTAASLFAPGVIPTALQLGTSDPRWWNMRDLWSATIPALQQNPAKVGELKFPAFAGLTEASFCKAVDGYDPEWSGLLRHADPSKLVPDELSYVVASNFFRELFGTELSKEQVDMLSELQATFGIILMSGLAPSEAQAKRSIEVQKMMRDAVATGEWGKGFLAEATRRGLDAPGHLNNLLVSFLLAGVGAPGSSLFAMRVIAKINEDKKKWVPVYQKDPTAFGLEVVRLKGAGGANSNYFVKKTTKWTLPATGKVVLEKEGTATMTSLLVTGYDPALWGGPSNDPAHAAKFLPGRENRDRMMSWMSELGDVKKCSNMTGCDAAPRFCPGTFFSQRLTRQVVDFFLEKCLGPTASGEL